jgi:hypothetical protein
MDGVIDIETTEFARPPVRGRPPSGPPIPEGVTGAARTLAAELLAAFPARGHTVWIEARTPDACIHLRVERLLWEELMPCQEIAERVAASYPGWTVAVVRRTGFTPQPPA